MERLSKKSPLLSITHRKTSSIGSIDSFQTKSFNRVNSTDFPQRPLFTENANPEKTDFFNNADEKTQKIQLLEKMLRSSEQKYKNDIDNMQSYINLLKKKISSSSSNKISSRSKCNLAHDRNESDSGDSQLSIRALMTKIQILNTDKTRLEQALAEAEKDMKRLYEEIKYQSDIIASYKEKTNSIIIEELESKVRILENLVKHEKEQSFKQREEQKRTEVKISQQDKEIEYLKEQVRFYEDSDISKEVKKYEAQKKNEKLFEHARAECRDLIYKFSKDINDKLSDLTLRAQQTEEKERKINNMMKLLQSRIITSGTRDINKLSSDLSKTNRDFEATKRELEEALKENSELHEALEYLKSKNQEKQEQLIAENVRLKNMIKNIYDKRRSH